MRPPLRASRLRWGALAALVVVALAAAYLLARPTTVALHGTVLDVPRSVQDVRLVRATGESVDLGAWRGGLTLVYFGYVNCPDVCPLTMAKLADTYRALGEPDNLRVIMVTVDPERDTPERLQRYVEGFHTDFVGLSGTPDLIADASAAFFVATVPADHNHHAEVAHSTHVTLLDTQGRMRVIYTQDKLDGLLQADLEVLLARGGTW